MPRESFMLPRTRRISTKLFKELWQKSGRPTRSPHFILRAIPSLGSVSRFAVVVPKRIAKSAVVRNRMRRRVYAALHPVLVGHDPQIFGVIVLAADIQGVSLTEMTVEIQSLLNMHAKYVTR
jgi:ribonuclease P protein component